jgi:hypothetical protein
MKDKIQTAVIIQMMGRPEEHLIKAAGEVVEAVGKEPGIKITNKQIHPTTKVENKDKAGKILEVSAEQQLYGTFAELDLEAENLQAFLNVCFKYMPSHIEIINPEEFRLENFQIAEIMNQIILKLHNYDSIAKSAIMQNQMMAQRLFELQKSGSANVEVNETNQNQQETKPEEGIEEKTSKKKKR